MTRRSSPILFAGALLFASTVSAQTAPDTPTPDQVATPFATSGGWNIYRYDGECSMMARLQRGNRLEISWPTGADMIGIHMHAPEMEEIEDGARYDLELYFHLRPGEGETIRASFMGSYSDELNYLMSLFSQADVEEHLRQATNIGLFRGTGSDALFLFPLEGTEAAWAEFDRCRGEEAD